VGDIAKSVLGGAWTLLVGWILPTALNLSVFLLTVGPSLRHTELATRIWPSSGTSASLLLLAAAILLGLVLNALQVPLYRFLEGYTLWPARAYAHGCERHRRAKHELRDRLALLRLERDEMDGTHPLPPQRTEQLQALRADARLARHAARDRRRGSVQRALLRERLGRYPIDDAQLAPTRLGNAIRRLEEYGYDRFRLDTQVLWNELTGTASDQVRRQVDLARTNVDFFIALLYGHAAVVLSALAALCTAQADPAVLITTAAVLGLLVPVWYRAAVAATDEWSMAVRALVNLGRKPLADALGLVLPGEHDDERDMWAMVSKLSRLPYHDRATALDRYRVPSSASPETTAQ
jgi:hypothetical protein